MFIQEALFRSALEKGFRIISRPAFFRSEYYSAWFDAIEEPFDLRYSPADEEFTHLQEEFAEINKQPPAGISGCLELQNFDDHSGHLMGFAIYTEQRFVPSGQGSLVDIDSLPAQRANAMPVLYVHRIATRKACQGRGGGKLLMACLFDLARSQGLPDVILESRVDSEGFYHHIGMSYFYDYMIRTVIEPGGQARLSPAFKGTGSLSSEQLPVFSSSIRSTEV